MHLFHDNFTVFCFTMIARAYEQFHNASRENRMDTTNYKEKSLSFKLHRIKNIVTQKGSATSTILKTITSNN